MGKKKSGLYLPDGREAATGKFSTSDFSIDGKSWDYRDPTRETGTNPRDRGYIQQRSNIKNQEHAYTYTNPLYDYSYGQVRDAAKDLKIGNVNTKGEVKQLLKQIQKGSKPKAENFKDDYIDKKIAPRENSDTEVEIPSAASGDATAGDNSIASPMSQVSGIDIAGDRNSVDQNNSIDQDQAGSFLDKYKLNLRNNSFGA
jgi:hypothetical protein